VHTPGGVLPFRNQPLRLSEGGLIRLVSGPGGLQCPGGGVGRVAPRAWRRDGDEEGSLYSIAHEITTTDHGMMLAIPEPEWDVFDAMSPADGAASWLNWRRVCVFKPSGKVLEGLSNLSLRRKSPQGRDMFQRLNCS